MLTESQVRSKAQELILEEFRKRVAEASLRVPKRCKHNYQHPLDTRPTLAGEPNPSYNRITDGKHLPVIQTIGLCLLEENELRVCEEYIDAKRCPSFDPTLNKETLYQNFRSELADANWVKQNMPSLYSLMWVLGQTPQVLDISWWQKLLYVFKCIKIEPVVPYEDPAGLLPEPSKE